MKRVKITYHDDVNQPALGDFPRVEGVVEESEIIVDNETVSAFVTVCREAYTYPANNFYPQLHVGQRVVLHHRRPKLVVGIELLDDHNNPHKDLILRGASCS